MLNRKKINIYAIWLSEIRSKIWLLVRRKVNREKSGGEIKGDVGAYIYRIITKYVKGLLTIDL